MKSLHKEVSQTSPLFDKLPSKVSPPHFILAFSPFFHCHILLLVDSPVAQKKEKKKEVPPSLALKAWLHIHAQDSFPQYVPQWVPLSSPPQVPFFMASNPNSSNFDSEKDCREIHGSWGQLNQLGQGLAHRSRTKLRQVRETYKAMYGEDLVDCMRRAKALDPKNEVRSYLTSRQHTRTHN